MTEPHGVPAPEPGQAPGAPEEKRKLRSGHEIASQRDLLGAHAAVEQALDDRERARPEDDDRGKRRAREPLHALSNAGSASKSQRPVGARPFPDVAHAARSGSRQRRNANGIIIHSASLQDFSSK